MTVFPMCPLIVISILIFWKVLKTPDSLYMKNFFHHPNKKVRKVN